jgi:hypothetical protein
MLARNRRASVVLHEVQDLWVVTAVMIRPERFLTANWRYIAVTLIDAGGREFSASFTSSTLGFLARLALFFYRLRNAQNFPAPPVFNLQEAKRPGNERGDICDDEFFLYCALQCLDQRSLWDRTYEMTARTFAKTGATCVTTKSTEDRTVATFAVTAAM